MIRELGRRISERVRSITQKPMSRDVQITCRSRQTRDPMTFSKATRLYEVIGPTALPNGPLYNRVETGSRG